MIDFRVITCIDNPTYLEKKEIADFLYEHLEEYGDNHEDIMKCLDYSLSRFPHQGGFTLVARENGQVAGTVVMCQTGMEGYIPENILVYIAVNKNFRGRGLGKQLMEKAIREVKGDIALHVEPDNPARKLYEKYGFTNKYLEMRLKNK